MSTRERAFERLVAINPLTDVEEFVPSISDAEAFLRGIKEGLMDTKTQKLLEPLEPREPRRRWLAAAAAFAVVILVIGGVALWPAGGPDKAPATRLAPLPTTTPPPTTVPPTTAAPQPTPPSAEQEAVIGELVAAYNAGDWNRYRSAFTDSAVVHHDGADSFMRGFAAVYEWDSMEITYAWAHATGSRYELDTCIGTVAGIECIVNWVHPLFADQGGPRRLTIVASTVGERISDYAEEVNGNDFNVEVMGFQQWLLLNAPDDEQAMLANDTEPRFTAESAALWNRWLPEYTGVSAGASIDGLAIAAELVAAFNAGDIDRYMAQFSEAVTFSFPDSGGPDAPQGFNSGTEWNSTPARWRSQKAWEVAIGGTIAMSGCADQGVGTECRIRYSDAFVRDVMVTELEGTATFDLDEVGRIVHYRQDWGVDGRNHDTWTLSFDSWLEDNYPSEKLRMGLNLSLDPIYTDESAQLWLSAIAGYVAELSG